MCNITSGPNIGAGQLARDQQRPLLKSNESLVLQSVQCNKRKFSYRSSILRGMTA